jgi:hypothetical protein
MEPENTKGAFFMSERKVVLWIWALVMTLLIGSMALAGFLARRRPEYLARPEQTVCAQQAEIAPMAHRVPSG